MKIERLFLWTLLLLFGSLSCAEGKTVEELLSYEPPAGWVKLRGNAELPMRSYVHKGDEKSGLMVSIAINERCRKGLGPKEYAFKNIVRFFGMRDRAVAQAQKAGQRLHKSGFVCKGIKPALSLAATGVHALQIVRPFPNGPIGAAFIHRVAFSDNGICYKLTLQGL